MIHRSVRSDEPCVVPLNDSTDVSVESASSASGNIESARCFVENTMRTSIFTSDWGMGSASLSATDVWIRDLGFRLRRPPRRHDCIGGSTESP
jgi:hypothetical protein